MKTVTTDQIILLTLYSTISVSETEPVEFVELDVAVGAGVARRARRPE